MLEDCIGWVPLAFYPSCQLIITLLVVPSSQLHNLFSLFAGLWIIFCHCKFLMDFLLCSPYCDVPLSFLHKTSCFLCICFWSSWKDYISEMDLYSCKSKKFNTISHLRWRTSIIAGTSIYQVKPVECEIGRKGSVV